jgi:hypothetical protein
MKKHILLMAGAAIILASCGGENKPADQGQTQAQIDSAVNAQVAEREAEMARKNDSTLKAMEAEKAAAEAAAAEAAAKKSGGKKTKTPKAEPAAPAPPPPPPPPATIGNGKPKMGAQSEAPQTGGQGGTIGNGKPKMGK